MRKKGIRILALVWTMGLVSVSSVQAQRAADMIFHNGRIVTVDDHGFNS